MDQGRLWACGSQVGSTEGIQLKAVIPILLESSDSQCSSVVKGPVSLLCPPWFIVDKSSFVTVQWDNYSTELIIAMII